MKNLIALGFCAILLLANSPAVYARHCHGGRHGGYGVMVSTTVGEDSIRTTATTIIVGLDQTVMDWAGISMETATATTIGVTPGSNFIK